MTPWSMGFSANPRLSALGGRPAAHCGSPFGGEESGRRTSHDAARQLAGVAAMLDDGPAVDPDVVDPAWKRMGLRVRRRVDHRRRVEGDEVGETALGDPATIAQTEAASRKRG